MKKFKAFLTLAGTIVSLVALVAGLNGCKCGAGTKPGGKPKPVIWSKTFGTPAPDFASQVQITKDGGYIVAATTGPTSTKREDVWLIKLNAQGEKEWDKIIGTDGAEYASSVVQTPDGGYALAASTDFNTSGQRDVWIVKLDSNGNKVWDKKYGGVWPAFPRYIETTKDSGYILSAWVPDLTPGKAKAQDWIIKLNDNGEKQWDIMFDSVPTAGDLLHITDGGYFLINLRKSHRFPERSVKLIKINDQGKVLFEKSIVPGGMEIGVAARQTTDKGFILLCGTHEKNDLLNSNILIIKTDANGNEQWRKEFGGSGTDDFGKSIIQTGDGGYVIVGFTNSSGAGDEDGLLIKLDSKGEKQWEHTYGGKAEEWLESVQATADGGYVMAGYTESFGAGARDVWVLKTDSEGRCSGPGCQ